MADTVPNSHLLVPLRDAGVIDDTGTVNDEEAMADEFAAGLLAGLGDFPVIDDTGDPFGNLDPQWRIFADHVMAHFDPSGLPKMLRPFAPAATGILAAKLAEDPEGSREMTLELIEMAVRDLGIATHELHCWDAAPAA